MFVYHHDVYYHSPNTRCISIPVLCILRVIRGEEYINNLRNLLMRRFNFNKAQTGFSTEEIEKLIQVCGKILTSECKEVEEAQECCICLSEYVEGDKVIQFNKCPHCMHQECIVKWFESRSFCPYCKQDKLAEISNDTHSTDEEAQGLGENRRDIEVEIAAHAMN